MSIFSGHFLPLFLIPPDTRGLFPIFLMSIFSGHFLPLFLIPPDTRGPLPAAFFCISCSFFCSSFCLFLKAISSSSRSCCCFLGAFRGFFFPPSRPDILMKLEVREQIGHETRPALEKND